MDYNKQAKDFLFSCNVLFQAVKAVPQKAPRWAKDGKHGTHYSITLSRYSEPFGRGERDFIITQGKPSKVIEFSFWNSIHAKQQASNGKSDKPKEYDVLAGLYMPVSDFDDFCSNFGYSNDSREAEATYNEVMELNKKLESLFTSAELEKLQEIQ